MSESDSEDDRTPFQIKFEKYASRFPDDTDREIINVLSAMSLRTDELLNRVEDLEAENETLRQQVTGLKSQAFDSPETRTKKGMVEATAKYRSLDKAETGTKGGALRYREVKDVTEAMFDASISPQTVYDGLEELESAYDCYSIESGPDGEQQLRITRETIPETLRSEVEAFRQERLNE